MLNIITATIQSSSILRIRKFHKELPQQRQKHSQQFLESQRHLRSAPGREQEESRKKQEVQLHDRPAEAQQRTEQVIRQRRRAARTQGCLILFAVLSQPNTGAQCRWYPGLPRGWKTFQIVGGGTISHVQD